MRRMVCLLAALVILCGMVFPAFAAGDFVPSISYKDGPDAENAFLQEGSGEKESVGTCIVVSSIKDAKDKATDIHQDARDLLLEVYKKLKDGSMKLPIDNKKYVVRELVDISFHETDCVPDHDHEEELKEKDITVTIKFDLGISKYTDVIVLSYNDGQWKEIKSVKNNGDGTVTCVFDYFCPVAFCVEASAVGDTPKTGDQVGAMTLWIVLLIASAAAVVALVAMRRKKNELKSYN